MLVYQRVPIKPRYVWVMSFNHQPWPISFSNIHGQLWSGKNKVHPHQPSLQCVWKWTSQRAAGPIIHHPVHPYRWSISDQNLKAATKNGWIYGWSFKAIAAILWMVAKSEKPPKWWLKLQQNDGMFTTHQLVQDFATIHCMSYPLVN